MNEVKNGKYKQDSEVRWYENGLLHRQDGPAIEWDNGEKEWYLNGKLHRLDGPAIEYKNGITEWYQHGLLHREHNLPAIDLLNGYGEWYFEGKRHRDNGPAVFYYLEHVEVKEWWLNGIEYTEEEFQHIIGKNITNDSLHIDLIDKNLNKQKIKI